MRRLVQTEVATVLGRSGPGDVPPDRGFGDLGFDSLTALELRNRLGALLGTTLSATVIFDHPSPAKLARHLLERLAPDRPAAPPPPPVLAELERLEASVADADDDLRSAVADRLWELLAAVSAPDGTAEAEPDEEVDTASADELYALIDDELGGSDHE
jgi:acyl carrier protein